MQVSSSSEICLPTCDPPPLRMPRGQVPLTMEVERSELPVIDRGSVPTISWLLHVPPAIYDLMESMTLYPP